MSTPEPRPADHRPVAIAFLALIFGLAGWAAPALLSFKAPPIPVVDGQLVRSFEKHYDEVFPIREAALNLWTAAQLLALGEGRPGLELGRDGWLFTAEEFGVPGDAEATLRTNFAFMAWAKAQLDAAGVPLIVAIVPEKAAIYADQRGRRQPLPIHAELPARAARQLDALGVAQVDLARVLAEGRAGGDTFLHTDTHWTPRGAELAAQAIAARLGALGLRAASADPAAWKVERAPEAEHRGDLLSYLPLEPMFPSLMPRLDRLAKPTTVPPASTGAADLLGDAPQPAIVLVGTSYTANANWNFPGFLEAALGEPVARYAKQGVGPMPPMAGYLLGDDLKQLKPRAVIWEIPTRALLGAPELRGHALPPEATGHGPAAKR